MGYRTKNLKGKMQKGQSLVEMIVAIAIILTGLVGALSLTISNLTGVDEAGTRVVASNLAREGIEVVRNFRDANWLQNLDWDAGLFSGNDFTAIAVFDPLINKWRLDFNPNAVSDPEAKLYRNPENLYLQDIIPPAGTQTQYARLITLDPICFNAATQTENISGNPCGAGEEKTGIRIKSEVTWNLSGRARDVTLEDRIYNWR
jgi:prepilin-type N-terminal cleavage/methylation domain-containing protein